AVDLDGEGDARAGFLQQVVRHVPGNLAAAGGLVPRGGAVGEHVRGAVHRGMEGFLLGIIGLSRGDGEGSGQYERKATGADDPAKWARQPGGHGLIGTMACRRLVSSQRGGSCSHCGWPGRGEARYDRNRFVTCFSTAWPACGADCGESRPEMRPWWCTTRRRTRPGRLVSPRRRRRETH